MKLSNYIGAPTAAVLLMMLPTALSAQDEILYAAPPPEDAAFVRFLGFEGFSEILWRELNFRADENGLQDYYVVHNTSIGFSAGDFVSIVSGGNGLMVEILEPEGNVSKVTLGFFNLTDQDLSLKTADGRIEIIGGVASTRAGFREVNPVSVDVQAFQGEKSITQSVALALRRNERTSVIAWPDGALSILTSEILSGVVE